MKKMLWVLCTLVAIPVWSQTVQNFNDHDCSLLAKFVASRIWEIKSTYGHIEMKGTFSPYEDFETVVLATKFEFIAVSPVSTEVVTPDAQFAYNKKVVRIFSLLETNTDGSPHILGQVTISAPVTTWDLKNYPPYGRSSSGHCQLEKVEF